MSFAEISRQLRAFVRSLRFRLMLWNGFAVLVTGVAILFSLRTGVQVRFFLELDEVLVEDLAELELRIKDDPRMDAESFREELNRKAAGHKYREWYAAFYAVDGDLAWASDNAPPFRLRDMDNLVPTEHAPRGKSKARPKIYSIGNFRVAVQPIGIKDSPFETMSVGLNNNFIERDMASIDRTLGLVGIVLLFAAPLSGYVLAERAIRPLAQMTAAAKHLRPAEMKQRLPVRQTADELDQLALTINGLLDRIAAFLRERQDFVANAAHELRTPLAAIRSSVEVSQGERRRPEEYDVLLELVISECSDLESLVNQLLLLAESDADRLKTDSDAISLDNVLARTVEMFRGVAEEAGVELLGGPFQPITVIGNRHHLARVVGNLIDNAVKYTQQKVADETAKGNSPPQGVVEVLLQLSPAENAAEIVIRDNGIGIEAEHLPRLFERFYRVDRSRNRDSNVRGAGLGLSICQALVKAHGGEIRVESLPGIGSTFTVSLPLGGDRVRAS